MTLATALLVGATPAQALITPPVTVDGPSADVLDFGNAAMASDGSGGLVYTKAVEGVPHVFASRYAGGRWSAPIRVDWDQPYEAGQPRIAAGDGGELLVVWVTGVATVHDKVQRGLFSARIGPGAASFGPSLLVDPNVGEGVGVDPSLSRTAPGQAIVAYRTITYDFAPNTFSTAVQLRPGDVMADIRVARLVGDRWTRLGAINRNPEASMRPPSPTNGPQVGAGIDGGAVVAWQEPDQTGAARIWMRRIFGTTPGQVLEASPASWEGAPVAGDADAFSLVVTPLDQARVAIRIAGSGSTPPRLLLNTLPPDYAIPSSGLNGPVTVFKGAQHAALGAPGVGATEKGTGKEGALNLVFVAGSDVHHLGVDSEGKPTPDSVPSWPAAVPGGEAVAALGSEGAGVLAYPALDAQGHEVTAVRQELPSGAAQAGLLTGVSGGPVGQLSVGPSDGGDALVGFRQGEAGRYEIVAERVSSPPASFKAKAPKRWVRPGGARLRWQAARSAVGNLTYAVLLEGRIVKRGLRGRSYRPPAALLGSGARRAQVMATDGFGQQMLSPAVRLRVDGRPPRVAVRVSRGRGLVSVQLRDPDSGLSAGSTFVDFGDGSRAHGGSNLRHVYERPGRFTIAVRARDKVGNRVARRFEAVVR
ncbi:MAG TPA: PKD domain-containing protein [Solirubrobacterales bacterium]|nr:PKD domain-containing protein [Solirubrobacterales bacterium]